MMSFQQNYMKLRNLLAGTLTLLLASSSAFAGERPTREKVESCNDTKSCISASAELIPGELEDEGYESQLIRRIDKLKWNFEKGLALYDALPEGRVKDYVLSKKLKAKATEDRDTHELFIVFVETKGDEEKYKVLKIMDKYAETEEDVSTILSYAEKFGDDRRFIESLEEKLEELQQSSVVEVEVQPASIEDVCAGLYPLRDNDYINPIPGSYIQSETALFGVRNVHPVNGASNVMHTGIDLGADCGTEIVASGDGEVVYIGWRGGYGNTIIIKHPQGLPGFNTAIYSQYSHLQNDGILVTIGDMVDRGEAIGLVGSTGTSTACHVHVEVRNKEKTDISNWRTTHYDPEEILYGLGCSSQEGYDLTIMAGNP